MRIFSVDVGSASSWATSDVALLGNKIHSSILGGFQSRPIYRTICLQDAIYHIWGLQKGIIHTAAGEPKYER